MACHDESSKLSTLLSVTANNQPCVSPGTNSSRTVSGSSSPRMSSAVAGRGSVNEAYAGLCRLIIVVVSRHSRERSAISCSRPSNRRRSGLPESTRVCMPALAFSFQRSVRSRSTSDRSTPSWMSMPAVPGAGRGARSDGRPRHLVPGASSSLRSALRRATRRRGRGAARARRGGRCRRRISARPARGSTRAASCGSWCSVSSRRANPSALISFADSGNRAPPAAGPGRRRDEATYGGATASGPSERGSYLCLVVGFELCRTRQPSGRRGKPRAPRRRLRHQAVSACHAPSARLRWSGT
jgi:hypothetical protein